MSRQWQVRTLGGLEICGPDSEFKNFGTRKARTLLARLILSNRAVDRDRMAGFLWPEDLEESTRPRLRTELHRLKSLLGEASELIAVDRESIGFDHGRASIDATVFEERLKTARSEADDSRRLATFGDAFSLYRGVLLPLETEDWFEMRRNVLAENHVAALEECSALALRLGDAERAVQLARTAVDALPLRTSAVCNAMQVLSETGDYASAIELFERYDERIRDQIGMPPDPRTQKILAHIRSGKYTPSAKTDEVAIPGNDLPSAGGTIFGREPAISSLIAFLMPHGAVGARIVSVLGPGGVGKTTISLETARRLAGEFGDRVRFIQLAEVNDVAGLTAVIARALGVIPTTGDLSNAIIDRIGSSPTLLVLDNFEQIEGAAGEWIADLVRRSPSVRILVTSRRPLGIEGEQRLTLDPLPTPIIAGTKAELLKLPAVALFVERARRVQPDYDPDTKELESIVHLTASLDGLPLALVLASSRIGAFTPEEMLRELKTVSGARTGNGAAASRHSSLADTIDWSLERIDPQWAEFVSRLTVFPRDWSMAAAREVIGPEAIEILPRLVEHSLVRRRATSDGSRFGLLSTIREHLVTYKGQAPGELRDRHAGWVLKFLEDLTFLRENQISKYMTALEPESENIETALNWLEERDWELYQRLLLHVWHYWQLRQWDERTVERLNRAALKAEAEGSPHVAELNFAASMLLSRRAQYQAASERADVAEVIFKKNNDRHALLGVYRLRVHVAYYRFDFEEMARWARKGIEEAVSPEDDVLLSASYTNLGLALANLDRGEQAIEVCERGIEFNRRRGDEGRALNGQQLLGTIYLSMRRWSSAEAILKSVLADAARLKDIGLQTQCQTHLTTVYLRTGRLVEAQNSLDEATALAGRYPDPFSKGVRHYLGTLIAIQVQDRATAMKRGYEVIRAWSGVGDAAILPAVDLAAFTLASFGDTQSGAYLFAHANGFRNRHGHSVSPHFAMVHEEAAALIGETLPAEDLGMDQIITYAVAALNRPPVAV